MASTAYRFGMTTKDMVEQAQSDGFKVEVIEDRRGMFKYRISHPLLTTSYLAMTPKHGEANGHFIRFLAKSVKQVRQLEEDTAAAGTPTASPAAVDLADVEPDLPVHAEDVPGCLETVPSVLAEVKPAAEPASAPVAAELPPAKPIASESEPPARMLTVEALTENILIWLDEYRKDGFHEFSLMSVINSMRHVGGDISKVHFICDRLVAKRILGHGSFKGKDGRVIVAYRINPALNGSGSIFDAYEGKLILPPASAPGGTKPEERPTTMAAALQAAQAARAGTVSKPAAELSPVPAQTPTPPVVALAPQPPAAGSQVGFEAALLQHFAPRKELLIDLMIQNEMYPELVQAIIASRDVSEGVAILKRIRGTK